MRRNLKLSSGSSSQEFVAPISVLENPPEPPAGPLAQPGARGPDWNSLHLCVHDPTSACTRANARMLVCTNHIRVLIRTHLLTCTLVLKDPHMSVATATHVRLSARPQSYRVKQNIRTCSLRASKPIFQMKMKGIHRRLTAVSTTAVQHHNVLQDFSSDVKIITALKKTNNNHNPNVEKALYRGGMTVIPQTVCRLTPTCHMEKLNTGKLSHTGLQSHSEGEPAQLTKCINRTAIMS